MNRVNEYRVWHVLEGRFLKNFTISFKSSCAPIPTVTEDYYNPETDHTNSYTIDNFYVQRWTGLLDKNRNPIYEGDILKIHVTGSIMIFSTGIYYARVVYHHGPDRYYGGYSLKILKKSGGENAKFNTLLYPDAGRTYEVVGNDRENPEILNE